MFTVGGVASAGGPAAQLMLKSLIGEAARVVVRFSDADTRQTVSVRQPDGRDEEQYLFAANDNITGTVHIHARCVLPLSTSCMRDSHLR